MRRTESGITLVEMVVVMAIIGMIAAISFPAVGAGLESVRLTSATDAIVAFFNTGLNRAERRQTPVLFTISPKERTIKLESTEAGFQRSIVMPEGVSIERVHPALPDGNDEVPRSFPVLPGGALPRIGVEIANRRGARRIVRVDVITGVAQVESVARE